jgi:hypothetical protein
MQKDFDEAKVALVMELTDRAVALKMRSMEMAEHEEYLANFRELSRAHQDLSKADWGEVRRRKWDKAHALIEEERYVEAQLWRSGQIGWSFKIPKSKLHAHLHLGRRPPG